MASVESLDNTSTSLGQKRPREDQQDPVEKLTICITNQEANDMFYKVEPHTRLQKVFKNYCKHHNMEYQTVSFIHDNHKLNAMNTPAQLGFKNEGEIILAALKKHGGGLISG